MRNFDEGAVLAARADPAVLACRPLQDIDEVFFYELMQATRFEVSLVSRDLHLDLQLIPNQKKKIQFADHDTMQIH